MKKAMVALLMIICAATLFAATWSQTIVLVSVVEQVRPEFTLEAAYVENGYAHNTSSSEISIESHNVKENVKAEFIVSQYMSRYCGQVEIRVSVTELYCGRYHTDGLRMSSYVVDTKGRSGSSFITDNCIAFDLTYDGRTVDDSIVAGFTVEYEGNDNLPEGTYVSHIVMAIESK